jgi:hypothetical protein
MGRWLSNIVRGRSIEFRESLNSRQLVTLVTNTPDAEGNIEIRHPEIAVISETLSLMELYAILNKEMVPGTTLETEHQVYSGLGGNQKHYLDIMMQTGDVELEAKITYEIKSDV